MVEVGKDNLLVDAVGGGRDCTSVLREVIPDMHEDHHPKSSMGDADFVLGKEGFLDTFNSRNKRSEDELRPVNKNGLSKAQDVSQVFLRNFFPFSYLPHDTPKEYVDEKLNGEREVLLVGRASMNTNLVSKKF